jgi:hypothetical protein
MSRLHPIPFGVGTLLVPDFTDPVRDERVVKPARRGKEFRRDRV